MYAYTERELAHQAHIKHECERSDSAAFGHETNRIPFNSQPNSNPSLQSHSPNLKIDMNILFVKV